MAQDWHVRFDSALSRLNQIKPKLKIITTNDLLCERHTKILTKSLKSIQAQAGALEEIVRISENTLFQSCSSDSGSEFEVINESIFKPIRTYDCIVDQLIQSPPNRNRQSLPANAPIVNPQTRILQLRTY